MKKILLILLGIPFVFADCKSAISTYGLPKYNESFTHFSYANPNAPKGGKLVQHNIGTFDSFNQFVSKGTPAAGLSLIYDTLMVGSSDEPNAMYGLVAKCIDVSDDKKTVAFILNPDAKFSNGVSIKSSDVAFTFNLLMKYGDPTLQHYYHDVSYVEMDGDDRVRFYLKTDQNSELPQILGQLPVFSKVFWSGKKFEASQFIIPLGSGPYTISTYQPGKFIQYTRNDNYWAKGHPTKKGLYNFDIMRWDYYMNDTVAFEAFKSHEYDIRNEFSSKLWATGYPEELVQPNKIIKSRMINRQPQGMQGFVFNTRRYIFKDRAVREAISKAFDFDWTNKNLFYSQYQKSYSYFNNSELAAPQMLLDTEKEIFNGLRAQLSDNFFQTPVPRSYPRNEQEFRAGLIEADKQLTKAGWVISNGRRVHRLTRQPLDFEILIVMPAFERVLLPFKQNLKQLGINMNIRLVDPSQFADRLRQFDYDMTIHTYVVSLTPGNELRDYWHSSSAAVKGSQNLSGIKNPIVDKLIVNVIQSKDRAEMIQNIHALDRVLMWEYYLIPQWYIGSYRVAYWDKFSMPSVKPPYDIGIDAWWSKQ
ncbi:MAG: extracellular solute-binding protein [Gammaproteobacteria bacterium]|nr:extracellular solute-binding protein [Gammaproteobacteria bacterium]